MRTFGLSTLLAALVVAPAARSQIEVRNSVADWSPTSAQQPVNGWSFYAYRAHDPRVPSSYVPMDHFVSGLDNGWRSQESPSCQFWQSNLGILQSPSLELEPVRAWVASASGTVQITPAEVIGRPIGSVEGDGVRLQLWRNAWMALDVEIPSNQPVNADFTTSLRVNAGDTLYFHCTRNRAPFHDGVAFNPQIIFQAGPGYATAPQTSSTTTAFPGNARWTPQYYDNLTSAYGAMTTGANSPDGFGPYLEPVNSQQYCRIWQGRTHTLTRHQTVWTYNVANDGQLLLRSAMPFRKVYAGYNPVDVEIYHRPAGSSARSRVYRIEGVGMVPRNLGKSLHVRAGDRVSVHVTNPLPGQLGLFTFCDLSAELHPSGSLRTPTVLTQPLFVTNGQKAYRFHERLTIPGDLLVAGGGHLELDDCVVMLDNSHELEFAYRVDGSLITRDSVLGGNRVGVSNERILHSNLFVPGDWLSQNTEVRYTYGLLLYGAANLRAEGHVSVAHGDFIHISGFSRVDIRDSVVSVAFDLPADRIADNVELDLRFDRFDTELPYIPWQGSPNWVGTMSNTMVFAWDVKLTNLTGPVTGQSVPYEIRLYEATRPERLGVRLVGSAASGDVPLFERNVGIPAQTSWQWCNSRWRTVGPGVSHVYVTADFRGDSAVRLTGPGRCPEYFVGNGSAGHLIGTEGTFDAASQATRIQVTGHGSRAVLDNCTLGSTWATGEVLAGADAHIAIRDARIDYPLALRADDNSSSKIIVSAWTGGGSLLKSGRVFEVDQHFSFDDNDDAFRNWDPAPHGFVNRLVQAPAPGATLPNNTRVLHLDFPTSAAYGNRLGGRIVAPGSGSGTILEVAGELYLYCRVRAQIANPRIVAGQPVITVLFSTRDPAVGWSSWGNYYRQMNIVADGQFHEYCWRLTDPANSPDSILGHGTQPGGGTALPPATDYWGLTFGLWADVGRIDGALGDFVEVDFLTLADHYDEQLRNW